MVTKEDILEKLLTPSIGDKHRTILKLALKGLEYEKIVEGQEFIPIEDHAKIASGVRTYWESKYEELVCEHRITVNNLRHEVDGLTRSRNLWRKKHDDLADELDDKIIALEEKLKDKDASLAEASKIINDARAKHRDLEAQLKNTVTLKYHDAIVVSAARQLVSLRDERDAFQRLVGKMQTENHCMRANLENMSKELGVLKNEIVKHEENYRGKNALIVKVLTENEELKIKIEKFKSFFTGEV